MRIKSFILIALSLLLLCNIALSETLVSSPALNAAISLLPNDSVIVSKYNELTGQNIVGSIPGGIEDYELQGPPVFSAENPSKEKLLQEVQIGDYLALNEQVMICIGNASMYFDAEENYPLFVGYGPDGAFVAYIALGETKEVPEGLSLLDLDGVVVQWFRI